MTEENSTNEQEEITASSTTQVNTSSTSDVAVEDADSNEDTNNQDDSNFLDQLHAHNPADFDWDNADKRKFGSYTKEEKLRLEELYTNTIADIKEHQILPAKIVSITDKYVVLDIGFKSDGLVLATEFKDTPELMAPGEMVDVYLESLEDSNGQLVLSRKKAKIVQIWEEINAALDSEKIIEGVVKRRTKGGLVVDLYGIEAFLPGSQIDVKPIRDFDIYVGKKMEFRVVKINHPHENVVVSHKILIEKDLEEQKSHILKNLEKGQVLEGQVKNITDFGVFIDLGGLDGLLHLTDLTWGRISHPTEILKLDQKLNVVVLDFDDQKKRISLGLKQLDPHPWENLPEGIQIGEKTKGKVVTVADYGVFIEIKPGVEGLIHVSELSWSQHLRNPQDYIKVGDEIEAIILTLEKEERKMSLSSKQVSDDPWKMIEEKYPLSSRHKGIIRNMTNFGLFVELEEGIDGLVHISDLSWIKKINHPSEFVSKEEQIEVVVLDIDKENRRLALGHKQLEDDPWDTFSEIFTIDSIHKCTITKLIDKGAILELPYGIQGFSPMKHLKKEDGSTAELGESLGFKVIDFSKENRKISLSHTRIAQDLDKSSKRVEDNEKEKEAQSVSDAVKKVKSKVEKTTLGDLDNALSSIKDKMTEVAKNTIVPSIEEEPAAKPAKKKTEAKKKVAEKDVADAPEVTATAATKALDKADTTENKAEVKTPKKSKTAAEDKEEDKEK